MKLKKICSLLLALVLTLNIIGVGNSSLLAVEKENKLFTVTYNDLINIRSIFDGLKTVRTGDQFYNAKGSTGDPGSGN